MTNWQAYDLELFRELPTGELRRTRDKQRIFWFQSGEFKGEILPDTFAAQLLGLTGADFGRVEQQSSPHIVPGPVDQKPPKREPFPWYKRIFKR